MSVHNKTWIQTYISALEAPPQQLALIWKGRQTFFFFFCCKNDAGTPIFRCLAGHGPDLWQRSSSNHGCVSIYLANYIDLAWFQDTSNIMFSCWPQISPDCTLGAYCPICPEGTWCQKLEKCPAVKRMLASSCHDPANQLAALEEVSSYH